LTTLVELLKMEEHQIPLKMQKDLLYPHFEPLHCQINPFWGFLNVSPPHKDRSPHCPHTPVFKNDSTKTIKIRMPFLKRCNQ